MTVSLALFDDYPEPGLGHHPGYLLGLAEASTRLGIVHAPPRALTGICCAAH